MVDTQLSCVQEREGLAEFASVVQSHGNFKCCDRASGFVVGLIK